MEVPLCQVCACFELSDVAHAVAILTSTYSLLMHFTETVCARCKLMSGVRARSSLHMCTCWREPDSIVLSLHKHGTQKDLVFLPESAL